MQVNFTCFGYMLRSMRNMRNSLGNTIAFNLYILGELAIV